MKTPRTLLALIAMLPLLAAPACPAGAETPAKPGAATPSKGRAGIFLDGRTLTGADGPFLGLGATYMQALRHCRCDRDRLHRELSFLSSCGFQYVRVLSMVDWPGLEIPPVEHRNREGVSIAAWPDYDAQLAELADIAAGHGLFIQITVFADAQHIMPDRAARKAHLLRVLRVMQDRQDRLLLCEIANEAWQNGFAGDEGVRELRELGQLAATQTRGLLALSAPPGLEDDGDALARLYRGSAANTATVHFSRDTSDPVFGRWRPVVDCWTVGGYSWLPPVSSNEPVGPGASVASEDEPVRILAAAAFAHIAGLPMYVFHSAAGVTARESFRDMPWLSQFRALYAALPPDLPNWERFDGGDKRAPLAVSDGSLNPLFNCGARKGDQFVVLAVAVEGAGRTHVAERDMSLSVHALPDMTLTWQGDVSRGGRLALGNSSAAYLIKGALKP